MRRPIYILIFLSLALSLSGCGKKKNSESIRSGRCARGGCATDTNNGGGDTQNPGTNQNPAETISGGTQSTLWGQIHKGSYSQTQFYDGVKGFVSANINSYGEPSELGHVSGDIDQNTGVWFWGDVRTQSGYFNPNGSQSAQLDLTTAELRIVVWDSYAGQTDSAGQVITEYPVHIRGATRGWVSGNQVTVRFEDSYGWVELVGEYDANYYSGYVQYSNNTFWDGGTRDGVSGARGVMGYFYVPTCGFFRCQ